MFLHIFYLQACQMLQDKYKSQLPKCTKAHVCAHDVSNERKCLSLLSPYTLLLGQRQCFSSLSFGVCVCMCVKLR